MPGSLKMAVSPATGTWFGFQLFAVLKVPLSDPSAKAFPSQVILIARARSRGPIAKPKATNAAVSKRAVRNAEYAEDRVLRDCRRRATRATTTNKAKPAHNAQLDGSGTAVAEPAGLK